MYGQTEDQEKQKKKIIIVSLIMGIIIIILIGVLINAITTKNKNKQLADNTDSSLVREDEKSTPTKVEENTKDTEKAEDTKLDPVANDQTDKKADTTVTPSSNTKDTNNLPSTGAGSILGLALLAGSATTYVFSKRK